MTIEEQISALIANAAPLRLLPDEEAEAAGLPGIVDAINALRAGKHVPEPESVQEGDDAQPQKRRGRPPKGAA